MFLRMFVCVCMHVRKDKDGISNDSNTFQYLFSYAMQPIGYDDDDAVD